MEGEVLVGGGKFRAHWGLPNSNEEGSMELFSGKNDLKNDQDERENKCITFRGHTLCRWLVTAEHRKAGEWKVT